MKEKCTFKYIHLIRKIKLYKVKRRRNVREITSTNMKECKDEMRNQPVKRYTFLNVFLSHNTPRGIRINQI